jgi:thiamine-monophosphate kinase
MLPEDEAIAAVARALGGGAGPGVVVGTGDDAAVLEGGLVVSTDMLVDGVHFDLRRTSPHDAGLRAAAVNLSDLAAMGAVPLCLVAAVAVPRDFGGIEELAAGMAGHGVPVAGGDLVRSDVVAVTLTAIGRADRPVLRSGGRPGDVLAVTGELGGQAASGYTAPVVPRLAEGRALAAVATAMMDVSDGIATDVVRLARASGTGAVVELERLPRAAGATVEQAAAGGEDYELLVALPAGTEAPVPLTVVGRLTDGDAVELIDAGGRSRALRGWDHFA